MSDYGPDWRAEVAYRDAVEKFEAQHKEPEDLDLDDAIEAGLFLLLAIAAELRAARIANRPESAYLCQGSEQHR